MREKPAQASCAAGAAALADDALALGTVLGGATGAADAAVRLGSCKALRAVPSGRRPRDFCPLVSLSLSRKETFLPLRFSGRRLLQKNPNPSESLRACVQAIKALGESGDETRLAALCDSDSGKRLAAALAVAVVDADVGVGGAAADCVAELAAHCGTGVRTVGERPPTPPLMRVAGLYVSRDWIFS